MVPEEGSVGLDAVRRAVEDWGFPGLKLHFGEVKGEITDALFLPYSGTGRRLRYSHSALLRP